jgi:hypothetical protein
MAAAEVAIVKTLAETNTSAQTAAENRFARALIRSATRQGGRLSCSSEPPRRGSRELDCPGRLRAAVGQFQVFQLSLFFGGPFVTDPQDR